MKIKKGTLVKVKHSRTGNWTGKAYEDFDTEDEWYALTLESPDRVDGLNTAWVKGEKIPARKGLCEIEVIKEKETKFKLSEFTADDLRNIADAMDNPDLIPEQFGGDIGGYAERLSNK